MRTVSGRLPAYFIPLDDIRKYCMKERAEASMHLYLLSTYSFVLRLILLFWNYKIESPENETALVHIPVLARESLPRQLYFTLRIPSQKISRTSCFDHTYSQLINGGCPTGLACYLFLGISYLLFVHLNYILFN